MLEREEVGHQFWNRKKHPRKKNDTINLSNLQGEEDETEILIVIRSEKEKNMQNQQENKICDSLFEMKMWKMQNVGFKLGFLKGLCLLGVAPFFFHCILSIWCKSGESNCRPYGWQLTPLWWLRPPSLSLKLIEFWIYYI